MCTNSSPPSACQCPNALENKTRRRTQINLQRTGGEEVVPAKALPSSSLSFATNVGAQREASTFLSWRWRRVQLGVQALVSRELQLALSSSTHAVSPAHLCAKRELRYESSSPTCPAVPSASQHPQHFRQHSQASAAWRNAFSATSAQSILTAKRPMRTDERLISEIAPRRRPPMIRLAMLCGTVVQATDWRARRRSRSSPTAFRTQAQLRFGCVIRQ